MDTTHTTRGSVKPKVLDRFVETLLRPEDVETRYEIQDTIGKGGFGVVSKVRELATGIVYVMKKMPFDIQFKSSENIQREIHNIISMKSNRNIVQWHDIFRTHDNKLAIIMDLCDMDLGTFLKCKENRTFDILFDVAQQITAGIAFLHTHDPPFIHRDIKPQNILIKTDRETKQISVKIADCGISNSSGFNHNVDGATKSQLIQIVKTITSTGGTLSFLAPEFFAALDGHGLTDGRFRVDASFDIFALGLVFAFMFCFETGGYGKHSFLLQAL